jgi:hypothetical protein
MKAPAIARVLGIAFLIAGVLGFIPYVTVPAGLTAEWVTLAGDYGFLAAVFPVNVAHDALHLLFGIWGLGASGSFAASVRFCKAVAWIYLVLSVLGAIPITNTLFGIAPIYGWDVLLHFAIGLVALYGGYGAGRFEVTPPEALGASMPPPAT